MYSLTILLFFILLFNSFFYDCKNTFEIIVKPELAYTNETKETEVKLIWQCGNCREASAISHATSGRLKFFKNFLYVMLQRVFGKLRLANSSYSYKFNTALDVTFITKRRKSPIIITLLYP
jgi:hypothetical protein